MKRLSRHWAMILTIVAIMVTLTVAAAGADDFDVSDTVQTCVETITEKAGNAINSIGNFVNND